MFQDPLRLFWSVSGQVGFGVVTDSSGRYTLRLAPLNPPLENLHPAPETVHTIPETETPNPSSFSALLSSQVLEGP